MSLAIGQHMSPRARRVRPHCKPATVQREPKSQIKAGTGQDAARRDFFHRLQRWRGDITRKCTGDRGKGGGFGVGPTLDPGQLDGILRCEIHFHLQRGRRIEGVQQTLIPDSAQRLVHQTLRRGEGAEAQETAAIILIAHQADAITRLDGDKGTARRVPLGMLATQQAIMGEQGGAIADKPHTDVNGIEIGTTQVNVRSIERPFQITGDPQPPRASGALRKMNPPEHGFTVGEWTDLDARVETIRPILRQDNRAGWRAPGGTRAAIRSSSNQIVWEREATCLGQQFLQIEGVAMSQGGICTASCKIEASLIRSADQTAAIAIGSDLQLVASAVQSGQYGDTGLASPMQSPQEPNQQKETADAGGDVNPQQQPCGREQGRIRRGREALRFLPDEIPFRPARNVERQQQWSPGGKTADAFGNHRRGGGVAQPARQTGFQPVHTDEGQIDQSGDPQAHVIEPDQDAQPAIGHQPQKGFQTPAPKRGIVQAQALYRGEARAQRAVLVVPGGIGGHLEKGLDDGRHPQPPALHPHSLSHHAGQPVTGEQMAQRFEVALEDRGQDDQVDAEQWCGDGPVDDTRQRIAIELLEPARYRSQIDGAPAAEQGIGDIVVDGSARGGTMDLGVAQQLPAYHLQLRGIEIPGQHAAHAAAQQARKDVGPACIEVTTHTSQAPPGICRQIHARAGDDADDESPGKTSQVGRCANISIQRQCKPQAQYNAAGIITRRLQIVP